MKDIQKFLDRFEERNIEEILKEKNISLKFCKDEKGLKNEINKVKDFSLITGPTFSKKYSKNLEISKEIFSTKNERFSEVFRIMKKTKGKTIIGIGGGRTLDIAKMVSFQTGKKLVLIPTAPTHDGLVSKNSALLVNKKKKSFPTKFPEKILVPEYLWKNSGKLRKFGQLDVLSNIVALEDVSLAMEEIKFEPEKKYMNLSVSAVKNILLDPTKELAQGLFLSGLAMEESSRYCSGSDHEIEKILMPKLNNKYFHGQLAGTGALLASKVYEKNLKKFKNLFIPAEKLYSKIIEIMKSKNLLKEALAPLEKSKEKEISKWLKRSSEVRPERYTLWNKINSKKINWNKIIREVKNAC